MNQFGRIASLHAAVVLALGVLLSPIPAQATLIGDSVHVTFRLPNFTAVIVDGGTQTIAAGTIFNLGGNLDVTFSASQITITNLLTGAFATGPGITFVGPDLAFLSGPAITNVTEDPASTPDFATGSVLSFSSNDINVNIEGTCSSCFGGETIILDVTTAAAVPEPATLVLFGTALVGFGMVRRRRKS